MLAVIASASASAALQGWHGRMSAEKALRKTRDIFGIRMYWYFDARADGKACTAIEYECTRRHIRPLLRGRLIRLRGFVGERRPISQRDRNEYAARFAA